MLIELIRKEIKTILGDSAAKFEVGMTTNLNFGDYFTNVSLTSAKAFGQSPQVFAEELIQKLYKSNRLMAFFKKIEYVNPGFINFYLSQNYLDEITLKVLTQSQKFGHNDINKGKKVIVEYSSPNIAKPFTVGHLRSTIIGDAIANLLEATGWEVKRDNHLGDWGTQFGKLIFALKEWGAEYGGLEGIKKSTYPVNKLVELYIKFHKEAENKPELEEKARGEFNKLEKGDYENRKIWQDCVEISMKEFDHIYKTLGIKFTENNGIGFGESYFEDKMPEVLEELEAKNLLKEGEEGAKIVKFPNEKYPPLMILKKDGSTLYATRDLAADKFRFTNYGFDTVIINEVGAEQSLYFQQLYELEKMLGWVKEGQRIHIKHGHFRFKDEKMSTRKGNVIWLDSVIHTAIEKANKIREGKAGVIQDIDREVAIGALKWNELKRDPNADIIFDWDEILNMEGNSAPYLQYTFARAKSIVTKSSKLKKYDNQCGDTLYPEEIVLMRLISRFEEVILFASKNYSSSILCNYLYELAQSFNNFYNKHKVIGSQKEEFRINLTNATSVVLENGLKLLGIFAPNSM